MLKLSHIIQKQTVEITFENPDNAVALQNQIAELFHERLQPKMQALFTELFGENYYASIDTLEIDCGLVNKKNWENEFIEQALRALKKELVQVNKTAIDIKKVEEKWAKDAFFFFLKNGFLPWNKHIDTIGGIEPLLVMNKGFISELKKLVAQHQKVAERLAYRFSKDCVLKIINAMGDDKITELKEINSLLENLKLLSINKHILDAGIITAFASDESINNKQLFLSFLLTKTAGNTKLQSAITEELDKIVDEKSSVASEEKQQFNNRGNEDEQSDHAIYITNAGVVLLHPFLPVLFEALMLIKDSYWIDKTSAQEAVNILQYMITGKEESEECDVMLNKILCGINIDEVLITEPEIDVEIKTECEILLKNVITHWSILKNTSIEGLRETFLQRNGKLSRVDNGWLLQVEQKTVDILLSHLPWGIGVVKLPWMNEKLHVEWA